MVGVGEKKGEREEEGERRFSQQGVIQRAPRCEICEFRVPCVGKLRWRDWAERRG